MNPFRAVHLWWGGVLVIGLMVLLPRSALAAVLTHRYSFDLDASDSVGTANGVLVGPVLFRNGAVLLNGSNSFVRLPNDLLTNYSAASLEVWFADTSINNTNAHVYAFTGAGGGLIYQLDGRATCYTNNVVQRVGLLSAAVGGTNHLIWALNDTTRTAGIYVNGILAGENTNVTLVPRDIGSTTNDCIGGCGRTSTVSNFNGSILEFRIYQGALTALEAAMLNALGPDQLLSSPGDIQAVRVVAPTPIGPGALFRAGVYADFDSVSNVNISTQPDLVLTSDNSSVLGIVSDQRLQTLALGTANLTALWGGVSNSLPVTVGVPQDVVLVHRYSCGEMTNDWILHDSAGHAHGRVLNTKAYGTPDAAFTGKGEMKLAGGLGELSGGARNGCASLPRGILSSLSEVTIETWLTPTLGTSYAWQRIFDFGSSANAAGVSYFFLTADGAFTSVPTLHFAASTNSVAGEWPRLDWTNSLPLNVTSCVAVTYSPVRGVTKLYFDGQPVVSGPAAIPLSSIVDTNNWLGKSQFLADSYFGGRYDEFRIYSGLFSDSDAAADFAAGPDLVGVDHVLRVLPGSNCIVVSWGPSATNLVLERSLMLGDGASWATVITPVTLQNGRFSVALPTTNSAGYYRSSARSESLP